VLIDELDWQWIFFVNVPIGIIALGLGVWLIPVLLRIGTGSTSLVWRCPGSLFS